MEYLAFPWGQLGSVLRKLSLSGAAGNAAAWVLFAALGLWPVVLWGGLILRKRSVRADLLLPLLAVTLSAGLWFLINPSYLERNLFPAGLGEMGKYAFALTIDGILLTWLLLRFLGEYEKMEKKKLLRSLQLLLGVHIVLLGAAVILQGGSGFIAECTALREGNTAAAGWQPDRSLGLSYVFLFLQTCCSRLPEVLELAVWVEVVVLLHSCEEDGFSDKVLKRVELLKLLSARFLAAILFCGVGVNLLQLLLAKWIYSSHYALFFPLREVLILLGILMLSRFYLESRRLKEDNELFI